MGLRNSFKISIGFTKRESDSVKPKMPDHQSYRNSEKGSDRCLLTSLRVVQIEDQISHREGEQRWCNKPQENSTAFCRLP